jgi:myosin heavy subunit
MLILASQMRDELERLHAGSGMNSANLDHELNVVKEERQRALDDVQDLQRLLLERETVNVESSRKLSSKDQEIANLNEELAAVRREQARIVSDHARMVSEAENKASAANGQLGESTRQQVASMSEARSLRERVSSMQEEMDKLRQTVHVLRQQSADQDVKIVQLEKQHDQDSEDKLGLNIALDSKQQELELVSLPFAFRVVVDMKLIFDSRQLKRSIGVKGTGGATPAVASRVGRRDSAASFKTPLPSRPPSSMSDIDKSGKSSLASTSGGKVALGKSTRPNVDTVPSASVTAAAAKKISPRSSVSSISSPPIRARTSTTGSVAGKTASTRASAAVMTTKRISSPPGNLAARRQSLAASTSGSGSDASSVLSDKENETPKARPLNAAARRMSMQPLNVPA